MVARIIRKILVALVLISAVNNIAFSEVLTLKIDGEVYERDMPQNIDECQQLIRDLIDIANTADEKIASNHKIDQEVFKTISEENTRLENKVNELTQKLDSIDKGVDKVSDDFNKELKKNTRFLLQFGAGPVIGTDASVGLHLNAIGSYRVFRNLQFGAEIFSSNYQNSNRNVDFGIGFILGYNVY